MSYRGALPPGQAQAFAAGQQPPPQPHNHGQQHPSHGQNYHSHNDYYFQAAGEQQQQQPQNLQYSGYPAHHSQAQFYQQQPASHFYPQQQQQQHQANGMADHAANMYQNYQAVGHGPSVGQRQTGGQYAVPDGIWQQPPQGMQRMAMNQSHFAPQQQNSYQSQMPSPQMYQQQQQIMPHHIHHQPSPHLPTQVLQPPQRQSRQPSPQHHIPQQVQHQHSYSQQPSPQPQHRPHSTSSSQHGRLSEPRQSPMSPYQPTPPPHHRQLQGSVQPQTTHYHVQQKPPLSQPSPAQPIPTPPSPPPPPQAPPSFLEEADHTPTMQSQPQDEHPQTSMPSGFVSLADIQSLPPLPPLPAVTSTAVNPDPASFVHHKTPKKVSVVPPSSPDPLSLSAKKVKREVSGDDSMIVAKPLPAKTTLPRYRPAPNTSISASPTSSVRSPSISKKSPASHNASRPGSTSLMVAVAEECIATARKAVHDVAMSLHPQQVGEYQKLIATGLACLEAALNSTKLDPREEARLRLRYASIVQDETEDSMAAETALSKGIALCEQHRLPDLKYSMRYQMLRGLFDRNHKAAMTAVDKQIADCEAFKHIHWVYAFRLLKASFHMQMDTGTESTAVENIRALHRAANKRGDNALSVFASLLEGLALLRSSKPDSPEKVRDCIAQAAKFQLDPNVSIVQLDVLRMVLDIASTLHSESPDITSQKLRNLQRTLDDCEGWHNVKSGFTIPIKKPSAANNTISGDTRTVLIPGDAHDENDYVVMSFMTKMEMKSLVFTLSGLVHMHKSSGGVRSNEMWKEGLKILDAWNKVTAGVPYGGTAVSLKSAIAEQHWRKEAQVYLHVLLGLLSASHCQWPTVQETLTKLDNFITSDTRTMLALLAIYLQGVYHQGTGNLQAAMDTFLDERLQVPEYDARARAGQQAVALLAAMNRLWIMQHPDFRDDQQIWDLLEQLEPLCADHPSTEIRTAWHIIMASIVTNPAKLLNEQRQHLHQAMTGVRTTNNALHAAITLCIMRSSLFENVVGQQALKSAKAAAAQAQRSKSLLWRSVADGMLAQSYNTEGQRDDAQREWDKATQERREAFAGS